MELKRLLAAPDPVPSLELMAGTGLLAAVLPEAGALDGLCRLVARGAPEDPMLRLAALLREGTVPALASRLRLSGAESAVLTALARPSEPQDDTDAALRRWLAERSLPGFLLWLAEARDGRDRAALRARVAAMAVPVFPVQGRDLLALGLPPGPAVGRLLGDLRRWWIAGGADASREACLAEARRMLEAGAAYGPAAPEPG
jgi:poly(A) polymerase/tRNA nucleotidyltransferase (CCA-adding enzyme)